MGCCDKKNKFREILRLLWKKYRRNFQKKSPSLPQEIYARPKLVNRILVNGMLVNRMLVNRMLVNSVKAVTVALLQGMHLSRLLRGLVHIFLFFFDQMVKVGQGRKNCLLLWQALALPSLLPFPQAHLLFSPHCSFEHPLLHAPITPMQRHTAFPINAHVLLTSGSHHTHVALQGKQQDARCPRCKLR